MNEEQIRAFIEQVKPELETALRAMMNGAPAHVFDFAAGRNSHTGTGSKLVCFLVQEPIAILLEGVLNSYDSMNARIMELVKQAQEYAPRIITN